MTTERGPTTDPDEASALSRASSGAPRRLGTAQWQAIASAFEAQMRERLDVIRAPRREYGADPVMDFLFQYYSFKPMRLCTWSPGWGVTLEGDSKTTARFLELPGFERVEGGVALTRAAFPLRRRSALRWIHGLLISTRDRAPYYGCGGMHEWAMVYRAERDVRHARWPMRMAPEALARFVESRPIRCTHHDAYRFFTPAARPLNKVSPSYETMQEHEQPGCLHANMDLYRWAHKFYPWIDSGLIEAAFDVAIAARLVDMRASPYDLRERGLEPITIETPEGRAEYQQAQRRVWEQARPIRQRLIEAYGVLCHAMETG